MSDKNAPVDEALDMVLVEMAEACIAGNLRATAAAVRKAHARLFAAAKKAADENFVRGYAIALADLNRGFDQPTMVGHTMRGSGITISMFKRAGVEAYDMKELRLADRAVTPLSKRR